VILLDASAVLALIYDEDGAQVVAEHLERDDGALSVVNLAEVLTHAERTASNAAERMAELCRVFEVVPVTEDDALGAARLWPATRRPALSLGDRIALATSDRLGVPILTADRAWADVPSGDVVVVR
jgi:ribonuclease VapC